MRLLKKLLPLLLCVALLVPLMPATFATDTADVGPEPETHHLRLWYDKPAADWESGALPIGNGNIGGMVFGKTDTEVVQLNEITLWAGGPNSSKDYTGGNTAGAYQYLPAIQQALLKGESADVSKLLGNDIGWNGYQNLGEMTFTFTGKAQTSAPAEYVRELDLDAGVARVFYKNQGVSFRREYFASFPGNVMAVHLTADVQDALGFTLKLTPDTSSDGYYNPSKTYAIKAEDHVISCLGEVKSSQMKFAVQVKVIARDADIKDNADGTITVTNGEDVLILLAAGTNYDISESKNIHTILDYQTADGDYLDNHDPDGLVAMSQVSSRIQTASAKTYAELLEIHQADYCALYNAASLQLGDEEYAAMTTDKLLYAYNHGQPNRYLENLLFQFGRYMLISSSRDSLPANLQGIWNNSNQAAWGADYHLNVNLQMNYWPAFVTNLAETAEPLATYLDSLRGPGNLTAREHFGVEDGWVATTVTTPLGMVSVGWGFNWDWTPRQRSVDLQQPLGLLPVHPGPRCPSADLPDPQGGRCLLGEVSD